MNIKDKFDRILAAIQKDPGNRGLARNPARNLFNAFPDDFHLACESIASHPNPRVAIVTGFIVATIDPPKGETDGPLGAAFLANYLEMLDIPSNIFTDAFAVRAIDAGIASYNPTSDTDIYIVNLKRNVDPLEPYTHVISIERVGPSRKDGLCYSMRGRDISDSMQLAEHLFDKIGNNRVTIGVGDGGNEIGMGKMPLEIIADNIPKGEQIACRVPTDYLIVAGVSNWGAYALAAGVGLLRGRPLIQWFRADHEKKVLEVMVEGGPLVDGVTGQQTATVDGLTWEQYIQPFLEIRDILSE